MNVAALATGLGLGPLVGAGVGGAVVLTGDGAGLPLGLGDSSITLTVTVTLSSRSPLAAAPCFSRPLITLVPGTRRCLGTVAVRAVVLLPTVLMTPVAYLRAHGMHACRARERSHKEVQQQHWSSTADVSLGVGMVTVCGHEPSLLKAVRIW
jgi:hypothetical protein